MPRTEDFAAHANATNRAPQNAGTADLDLLGIGFGPSNLSLAIAIEEYNREHSRDQGLATRFLDAKQSFSWHNGMLLPETTMQISFLKDLVSLRTPTSPYTFVNYLHDRGRLPDFINLQTFFPSRQEFHDYLLWAADRISVPVSYGVEATKIDWQAGRFVVTTAGRAGTTGSAEMPTTETITARNVVIGAGLQPSLPEGIIPSPRAFHNHELIATLAKLPSRPNRSFLVVGSGQSAAEVTAHLHETYGDAEVHASFRRFGYTPSDDTPYANRIFDPEAVEEYYTAPSELKQRLMNYHRLTNYSAVDGGLIKEIYRREYDERVRGTRRLTVHRVTEIADLQEHDDSVSITLRDLAGRHSTRLTVDAVVFATGYAPFDIRKLLGPTIDQVAAFERELPVVERDYSFRLPGVKGRIYLNGGVEHTHGLSSSLLSNVPIRAADILGSMITEEERCVAHA